MRYVWLSFCDANRPDGEQFLGAIVTEAPSVVTAVLKTHLLKINPGGEILTVGPFDADIGGEWLDRLLTREECERFDEQMMAEDVDIIWPDDGASSGALQ